MDNLPHKFWQQHLLGLLGYGFLLLVIFRIWPIDDWLIQPFVGTTLHPFPLKDTWWLSAVAHQGLKYCTIGGVIGLLLIWSLSFYDLRLRPYRSALLLILVAMACSSSTIGILKSFSHHSCPWHMTIYGGIGGVEYPLLSHVPIDAGIGKCFPGGHAAGGFAWIALYFAAIQQGYRRAWCYAIFGVLLGMLMGYTQMMRGAHFMSHNLWTLWWTWFVQLVVFSLWYAPAKEETNANG